MSVPARDLVNVFEMEAEAKAKLSPAMFAEIASGTADRRAFDRITFRPRLMQNVTQLDLSVELFGEKQFTPILIGPVAQPSRFHAEGQPALRQGAEAAKATLISTGSGEGWVHLEAGATEIPPKARVLVVRPQERAALERLRKSTKLPIVVKGILSVDDAHALKSLGINGIVVSNYGVPEGVAPLEALPLIAEAVGSRMTLLVDGGFRRGTDIAKALALGARGVLITRPALWGLAAHGAEGVQVVIELLQAELARAVAMLGKVNVAQMDRTAIRLHRF